MHPIVRAALDTALSQDGVRELPENRGQKVEMYLRAVGLGAGNPWCAAFVYWAIDRAVNAADVENPFIRTGFCPTISTWADEHNILFGVPEPGDVFLLYAAHNGVFRARHTGLVTGVNGAVFSTVEGNTNLDGSAEGVGVFQRTRSNSNRYRFVRWGNLLADEETYTLVVGGNDICTMPVRGGRSLCPVRKWCQCMGFQVDWNNEEQVPLFNGVEVSTETVLIGDSAYAPIRDLAEAAGLVLQVDGSTHRVTVTRPA